MKKTVIGTPPVNVLSSGLARLVGLTNCTSILKPGTEYDIDEFQRVINRV